jgi:ankyrin repeat protein
MKSDHLYDLCRRGRNPREEIRNYLASANDEDKKPQVSYQDASLRFTCLHLACINGASDDIIKLLIDIGGRELVMVHGREKNTALQVACIGASFNVIKMRIDV